MTPTNSPALVSDEQAAEWQAMVERITGKTLFTTVTATSAGRDWLNMVNGGFERLLADRAARVERIRQLESFAPADFEAIKLAIGDRKSVV